MAASPETLQLAADAVERLVNMFRLERYFCLAGAVLSFALLLVTIGSLLITKDPDLKTLLTIFGTGSVLTAGLSRILYIFNKAFALIADIVRKMTETTP